MIKFQAREEWLDWRSEPGKYRIGASMVADCIGVGYQSPYAMMCELQGLTPKFEGNLQTRRGSALEALCAELYQEQSKLTVLDPGLCVYPHDKYDWLFATPDRKLTDGRPVELKTTRYHNLQAWRDGNPPNTNLIQLTIQMACMGVDSGVIAALIIDAGKDEFHAVEVEFDADLFNLVLVELQHFRQLWIDGEMPDVDGHESTLRALRERFKLTNGETIIGDDELQAVAARYVQLGRDIKITQDERDEIKAQLLAAIGPNSGIQFPDGTSATRTIVKPKRRIAVSPTVEDLLVKNAIPYEAKQPESYSMLHMRGIK